MARISVAEVNRREAFVHELFVSKPETTANEVQDALVAKFGSKMSPIRMRQLQELAAGGKKLEPKVLKGAQKVAKAPKVRVQPRLAGRNSGRPATTSARHTVLLVEGTGPELTFFKKTLESLRAAGLSDLAVRSSGDSFLVVG